tara:strand:+ start:393 stop:692 length:300 start_codon:yes stop_codon:yes gene_type:complete
MKKAIIATALACSLTLSIPAQAKNACETVICLAGLVQGGSKVSNCGGAYSNYFSIRKFKKGKFRPDRTFNARASFLGQCPQGGIWNSKINNKFGRLFNF